MVEWVIGSLVEKGYYEKDGLGQFGLVSLVTAKLGGSVWVGYLYCFCLPFGTPLDQELFEKSKENRPRIGAPLTNLRAMGSKDCSQRVRSARNPFGSRVV